MIERVWKAALGAGILVAGTTIMAGTAQAVPPGCGGTGVFGYGGDQCDYGFVPAGHTHCYHVVAPFVDTWNCGFVPN